MRWLRATGALATLLLALVGAPSALLGWGRYPVDWPAALTRPDDGSVLLVVLTAIGWLAWVGFATSTLAEVLGLIRGRRFRIPLLGGLQRLCAGLLFSLVTLTPSGTSAQPGPPAAVAATQPEPLLAAEPDEPSSTEAEPEGRSYRVAEGDDLWSLSARLLGDGGRWRELVAANPATISDPTARLAPGTRLVLPAAGAHEPKQVTVRRGDTLSGLALEHLGAAGRWPRLAAANADLIEDPDHIEVGWRLDIPAADRASRARRDERKHPVQPDATTERDGPADAPHSQSASRGSRDTEDPAPELETAARAAPHQPHVQADPAQGVPGDTAAATDPEPVAAAEPAADPDEAGEQAPALPLLGTLGTLAAAAIIGVLETRRALRLRARPVGRRLLPPEESAIQLRTAIGARERPDRLAVLNSVLRAIGRHCHSQSLPLPEVGRIVIREREIVIEWRGDAGPAPAGFGGDQRRWTVSLASPPQWAADAHPCPYPAVVSLGSTAAGDIVLVDAERARVLGVSADSDELRRSALAAMGTELACAPWAEESVLVVTGPDADVVAAAGGERVQVVADVTAAVAQLRALVAVRRAALSGEPLAELRIDPDRADAVTPVVFLFLAEVTPAVVAELDALLAGVPAGVAAIVTAPSAATAQWQVAGDVYAPTGHLLGESGTLRAHGIPAATRAGLASLLRSAQASTTTAALWWHGTDDNVRALPQRAFRGDEPVEIVRLVPAAEQPHVLLIGPTDLRCAAGPEPARSRQQLIELCAWLLEHPGSTATAMTAGLAVAEGTRRSNLSRLRTWLGTDADGQPYLPDAYSGRVLLHPAVTSDWHRLQLLLQPGIDRVADSTLVAALELVRGAPLADAAPGQWHWAEELRTDIACALRDAGVVLTDRALARGDIDLARWAAARALVVAPEDELLLCARIRTEHRARNGAEVERLVNQVTRQARMLGVDLLPETVVLCQEAVEGRLRARQA